MSSSYRSSRLGLSYWDPYAMHRAYSCIIVTWWSGPDGIQALSARPTGFLQCFDTVGLVIWPVKIVPNMTYNVFRETLNLAQSISQSCRSLTSSAVHWHIFLWVEHYVLLVPPTSTQHGLQSLHIAVLVVWNTLWGTSISCGQFRDVLETHHITQHRPTNNFS